MAAWMHDGWWARVRSMNWLNESFIIIISLFHPHLGERLTFIPIWSKGLPKFSIVSFMCRKWSWCLPQVIVPWDTNILLPDRNFNFGTNMFGWLKCVRYQLMRIFFFYPHEQSIFSCVGANIFSQHFFFLSSINIRPYLSLSLLLSWNSHLAVYFIFQIGNK